MDTIDSAASRRYESGEGKAEGKVRRSTGCCWEAGGGRVRRHLMAWLKRPRGSRPSPGGSSYDTRRATLAADSNRSTGTKRTVTRRVANRSNREASGLEPDPRLSSLVYTPAASAMSLICPAWYVSWSAMPTSCLAIGVSERSGMRASCSGVAARMAASSRSW